MVTWYKLCIYLKYMCVFFTLHHTFYPSTSSTTSVRADFSILESYKLGGDKTTPEILHCYTVNEANSAMACHHTGCDSSSIARFSLLGGLVPCYPVYRLRPAFVNYAPRPERMRQMQCETSKAGSSSTHATRLLSQEQKAKHIEKENANHGGSSAKITRRQGSAGQ